MTQHIDIGSGGLRGLRGILPALALLPLVGCSSFSLFDASTGGDALTETSYGSYAVATQRALEYLPDAESLDWVDPETGAEARVTVLSTDSRQGRYCRQLDYRPQPSADPVRESYCRNAATQLWEIDPTPST
ncbi:MAG: hypothetical protein ACFCVH_06845 [Alphaproteobacteria bacterium]